MPAQALRLKDPDVRTSIRCFEQLTADYQGRSFAVRLWEGTTWCHAQQPHFTLVIKHPGALRNIFASPTELTLGRAFIDDDLDIEGDLEGAFELVDLLLSRNYPLIEKVKLGGLIARLPKQGSRENNGQGAELHGSVHSKERDRDAVTYHYDVSNEFYSLWLDRSMVYSCAYFKSAQDSIDTAQTQKLDYICRKLRLRKGDRLLDIGCGWGGLLIHAARNYGVDAFGITLSAAQAEVARQRIREAGLGDRCRVDTCDYRDLDARRPYDKLASVGMFEHVGQTLLPEYFRQAWRLLRPGGVFLNHGIAASATFERKGPSFIDKYVFPDGELVPIHATLHAAESVGFEVRDVESLREHYALTLGQWVRELECKAQQARSIVGEFTYRVWRLYMSGSAHAFKSGRLNLFQVLLSKQDRGESYLPLTREDWFG